ncbi:MAG: hypothetical protein KIPDCIKN_02718 [Haliscomenobacter sp.]|jgi:hypothetical protein|nr:hypothetical protein [Haliscomenobacter sp.]
MMQRFWILLAMASLLFSCQMGKGKENGANRLLAKAYGKELRISEMEGMFPPETSGEDSLLIINAYVQRWIRETLLLHEAERNLPKDLNIDKLVLDYRASLIKNNYEQVLVEQLLDSTITKEELQEFYERNKDQYQLETPIVRCYFIKVPSSAPEQDSLNRWWNNPNERNLVRLNRYCDRYAVAHILNDSTWHRVDELASAMPEGTLSVDNIDSRREFRQSDDSFQYFFRLLELRNSREIAPLAYIESQARKFILHVRKTKLLEQKREDLYEVAMRRKEVQLFTK